MTVKVGTKGKGIHNVINNAHSQDQCEIIRKGCSVIYLIKKGTGRQSEYRVKCRFAARNISNINLVHFFLLFVSVCAHA